jgi:hypothetical protein
VYQDSRSRRLIFDEARRSLANQFGTAVELAERADASGVQVTHGELRHCLKRQFAATDSQELTISAARPARLFLVIDEDVKCYGQMLQHFHVDWGATRLHLCIAFWLK